jgi:ribosomal protein L40E
MPAGQRRRDPIRSVLIVLFYAVIGVAGGLLISRIAVEAFPWQQVPSTDVVAWRSFDGFFSITFGTILTIGIAMLVANLLGRGINCPRCGTRNPGDATSCMTCDLPLPPRPTARL